jgi:hypothetical protein
VGEDYWSIFCSVCIFLHDVMWGGTIGQFVFMMADKKVIFFKDYLSILFFFRQTYSSVPTELLRRGDLVVAHNGVGIVETEPGIDDRVECRLIEPIKSGPKRQFRTGSDMSGLVPPTVKRWLHGRVVATTGKTTTLNGSFRQHKLHCCLILYSPTASTHPPLLPPCRRRPPLLFLWLGL